MSVQGVVKIAEVQEIRFVAVDLKSEQVMKYYVNQFFSPEGYEKKYVVHILKQYVQNDFQADRHEFREILASAAASGGVKYKSLFCILDRYIILYWDNYAENWKKYFGWNEKLPPSASRAMQLFCKKYSEFFPAL